MTFKFIRREANGDYRGFTIRGIWYKVSRDELDKFLESIEDVEPREEYNPRIIYRVIRSTKKGCVTVPVKKRPDISEEICKIVEQEIGGRRMRVPNPVSEGD